LKKVDKEAIVQRMQERASRANLAVIAEYKGLNVQQMVELRRRLREGSTELQVIKNTLLLKASEGTWLAAAKEHFSGPNAVALSYGDPVGTAKILVKYAGEQAKFQLKAGVLGGKVIDAAGIKALSTLPGREELLGQVLRAMNGVPTGLVRALSDVPRRMLNVLQAVRDQRDQKEAA